MNINHAYWEDNTSIHHLKYESCNSNDGEQTRLKDESIYRCCDGNLNFATVTCEDDTEFSQFKKNKVSRQDPMSHRIIEKRRRDRMNNCLADLSRLIPAEYLKKGRGRIEKTEIIEMAIKHIKYLQQTNRSNNREYIDRAHGHEQYRLGFQECMSETMRFLVEVEGYFAREALCVRLINHLQKHCDTLLLRECVNSTQIDNKHVPIIQINNSTSTTMKQIPVIYENGSHLRDILINNNNIKDEINTSISPNIINENKEEIINNCSSNLTRLPSPDNNDKQQQITEDYIINNKKRLQNQNVIRHFEQEEQRSTCRTLSESENYSNGVSLYKFKNNIKQRFSQDLTAEINQYQNNNNNNNNNKFCKRRKTTETTRKRSNSLNTSDTYYYSENHSSSIDDSRCSPSNSELYRLSSESENARISPTGSSDVSCVHSKSENTIQKSLNINEFNNRYSPDLKQTNNLINNGNFNVPIFALHAKGSFYIPLTIDYNTLVPYLQHHNMLEILPNIQNIILHPVTINVNFQSNYFNNNVTIIKPIKNKLENKQNGWH